MGSTGNTVQSGGVTTATTTTSQDFTIDDVQAVATQQQAQNANNANFPDTDDGDYREVDGKLRDYFSKQSMDIDTKLALKDYLYDQPINGLYSPSQSMNYKLKYEGQPGVPPLTANERYMRDSIVGGMHNLGQNMELEHYGRASYIDEFGKHALSIGNTTQLIDSNNFYNMSEADLRKAFVGITYGEKGIVSTSVNHFSKAPNGGKPFTDKVTKITIKAPASAQGLMPGNGPGGALGEMLLAPNQHYKIVDVKFTGKQGRSQNRTYPKQIEFVVEIV